MPKSKTSHAKKKSKKTGSRQSSEIETQAPLTPGPTSLAIPVAAIGSILAGLVVIILSFLEVLPQAPQPQYNIVGLVLMSFGFIVATQIK
ncbi:MAG TPA: cell division protein CrgA [Acidimicrobiia bacterium]|nr:cell division protein CrgA [Acidimicrobiia bacterium]